MAKVKETLQQAAEVVDEYALFLVAQAQQRVNKEMHGEGCGCKTCRMSAQEDKEWADEFFFSKKKGGQR